MKILQLALGEYQTNCYLVADEDGNAAVIDPGYEPERILEAARDKGWKICAILLTHGHFDHVGGVRPLAEALRCPVWIHEEEEALPPYLTAGTLYYTDTYDEGDTVKVGSLSFQVLHTPGHTRGSVCLLCENALFSGDTLFAGSCGRCDLYGGSFTTIRESLRRLKTLEGSLLVFPGHGSSSTLEAERTGNPYML